MPDHAATLDPLDARLLDALQRAVPLEPRPFAALARQAGVDEDACLTRLRELRGPRKVIRQVSAIFDTAALGYESSLVAAKYEPDQLEAAAAIVSGHPGVSHNYQRNHAFNLWYTLAVPPAPDSTLGLNGTIERLHELSGAIATRALPTLKLFKIGVRFDLGGDSEAGAGVFTQADRAIAQQHRITDADKPIIRVAQQDLPLVAEPWEGWARQAGCTVAELLEALKRFQSRRQMRRFSAVLHHHAAGFSANVMGVWQVDPAQADHYGPLFAQQPEVSHCYLRPSYPDFPYSIYTMVHGRSREEALGVLAQLRDRTGVQRYDGLWSERQFKKVRVKYFTPETSEWEAKYG